MANPVVVSEPVKELPQAGQGHTAKYVRECRELYLGGKRIEKLRNFELFVNLESLWLDNNNLKKRTRLSHLRDLDKQIRVLEKFAFIRDLNLKGNPLCEEPDYRLIVVHRLPGLKVLDQHVVTAAERRKATGVIGGDLATLTVAFGKRAPAYDPAWDDKVPERSALEGDMAKEATTIRDNVRHEAYMRERGMFLHDPHPEAPRGGSLPPNAGTVRAMQVWRQQHQGPGQGPEAGPTASQPAAQQTASAASPGAGTSGRGSPAGGSGRRSPAGGEGGKGRTGSLGRSTDRTAATSDLADAYVPRDTLVLYTLRAGQDPLSGDAASHTLTRPPQGTIKFDQGAYEQHLQMKAAGVGSWQVNKAVVQL
ncbi:Leucine-rich repeat-containing protein 72 [Tetrabaena socialis]|uniref:Leucine-rich repeat-containing protein 72 n=1 Tax=Tetrabaena socialis TaxID=47790 RepID=A0A2J7ZTP2_9CHLO|nr:Leucine-rich repeat-containing protein 72 [Tetrabaena socialis]|eukprot:PNH03645.1 Leucine-rich repeat-containing protein 72 [Tetrabaena socialis]